ncbi:MAG: cyclic dehypoxanthinyl futalosine synthase [Symbiobacteriia bacterium]
MVRTSTASREAQRHRYSAAGLEKVGAARDLQVEAAQSGARWYESLVRGVSYPASEPPVYGGRYVGPESAAVDRILLRALDGERITIEEGDTLMRHGDLGRLSLVAGALARRLHPGSFVSFIIDRNINYSNVCVTDCGFCAFYRHESDPDAYVLSHGQILQKVQELADIGGSQILMQGGHHPKLPFSYYTELLEKIRARFPQVAIHSFSPSEVTHFSRVFKRPVREILTDLKAAGLHSVAGGGAEILDDRVRGIIAPHKASTAEWLGVMEEAADLGLKASATMMFGHVETLEERVLHLERLRQTQERTRDSDGLGVFRAFAAWTYQDDNTALGPGGASAFEYLRVLAVARIYLDNIPNIQASWVTQGPKVGQISLDCGCNDLGGTMMEENVVSAAGTTYRVGPAEAIRLIKDAGRTPARRNTRYEILETY